MPSARIGVLAILIGLPLLVFGASLFAGQAFVPADLLSYVAPWSSERAAAHLNPWNVLRFDGITQFYPWRLEAARAVHEGRLPFWNPFEFAAAGGAPLWANSQSAPLYPLNALFYVFPLRLLWFVFGLVAAIHLEIAASGSYLFLRRCLRVGRAPALLAAITFVLSGPVTCWLALPTFLSVACWIPWLLLTVHVAIEQMSARRATSYVCCSGFVAGLMILGGHLQITLYGLSFAIAYALFRWRERSEEVVWVRRLALFVAACVLGLSIALGLAAPQLLPAVELSKISHRASTGFPTWSGYQSYVVNALPIRNLVTLLFPNFFGHPNWRNATYWNTNNYGEWALFSGITPVLLACFSIGLPWRRKDETTRHSIALSSRGFFAIAATVALLIAMGTPLNVPLFFFLPGYSQTGNPGRILVVFAFAIAVLAAIGLEAILDTDIAKQTRERASLIAFGAPALIAAIGASRAAAFQKEAIPGTSLSDLLSPAAPSIYFGCAVFVASAVLITRSRRINVSAVQILLVAVTAIELFIWGWGYNPTVAASDVYRPTPGIKFLLEHSSADDLIAPLNRGWSLSEAGPHESALPPNGLTVYGLHDISGYDSLFPKSDKDQVREAGEDTDPSPPENGNIVFVKGPETAVRLGARYIVVAPDAPLAQLRPGIRPVYQGDDLLIYENQAPVKFRTAVGQSYAPASIRLGLFAGLTTVAGLMVVLASTTTQFCLRRRPQPERQ